MKSLLYAVNFGYNRKQNNKEKRLSNKVKEKSKF